jgi:hypothetical protein
MCSQKYGLWPKEQVSLAWYWLLPPKYGASKNSALLFSSIPVSPSSYVFILEKIASNFSIRKMNIMMDFLFPLKLIGRGQ